MALDGALRKLLTRRFGRYNAQVLEQAFGSGTSPKVALLVAQSTPDAAAGDGVDLIWDLVVAGNDLVTVDGSDITLAPGIWAATLSASFTTDAPGLVQLDALNLVPGLRTDGKAPDAPAGNHTLALSATGQGASGSAYLYADAAISGIQASLTLVRIADDPTNP